MTSLENMPVKYSDLISEVRQVKLNPQFQRKFVWDIKSSAKLLDSINEVIQSGLSFIGVQMKD